MKVVLFCGGFGTRIRDRSENIPKPLVRIGYRPIIWHLMKYYAHFGHKEFILCLGYKGDVFKEFFEHILKCNPFTGLFNSDKAIGNSVYPSPYQVLITINAETAYSSREVPRLKIPEPGR